MPKKRRKNATVTFSQKALKTEKKEDLSSVAAGNNPKKWKSDSPTVSEAKGAAKEEYPNQSRWQGLFRGSLLSTTINKQINYVGFADRRAQGIITINAILIPVAINGSQNPLFQLGSILAVLTAILSISAATYSLYPKSYTTKKEHHKYLLHFSQIQKLSESHYMKLMKEALADTGKLAELATHDLYHLSTRILKPKFFWLKVSYFIFLFGYIISIGAIGWQTFN